MDCGDPSTVGTRTEGIVLAALLERGYQVLLPFGNRAKYDFVIDDGARLQRVQCKTAHAGTTHDTLRFVTYSLSASHGGRRRKCSYRGLIDLFAVYYPPNAGSIWFRWRMHRRAVSAICACTRREMGRREG